MFRQMTATKQHKQVILVGDGAVGSWLTPIIPTVWEAEAGRS